MLLWQEGLDAFKQRFWKEHLDPATMAAPEAQGGHAGFHSRLLASNSSSASGFFVGDSLTIAGEGYDGFVGDSLSITG